MYVVYDSDFLNLDIFQCYECGFHVNAGIVEKKGIYSAWEKLFYVAKGKGLFKPKLLPKRPSDESLQGDKDRRGVDRTWMTSPLNEIENL